MRSPTQVQSKQTSSFEPLQTGLLQRKCSSCGQHSVVSGECAKCQKKQSHLQRRPSNQNDTYSEVPSIVNEVLRSPGQPLPFNTKTFMESVFGHDFSHVKVHTDSKAAESAQAVNALAYTVGDSIVFGSGQYTPETSSGKRLLAHELTHVIQQSGLSSTLQKTSIDIGSNSDRSLEREADRAASRISSGQTVNVTQKVTLPGIQRYVLSPEPAGGCGVCYDSPRLVGNEAHKIIQTEFQILNPLGLVELPFSSPTDENGRLDLAVATPTGFEIGEIKPANEQGYTQGATDIAFYVSALESAYPEATINPLTTIIPPTIFPNPQAGANCPTQEIFVNPPVGGVYGYYCRPTFSELIRNPNCRCNNRRRPNPREVPVTAPVPEQIADKTSRLRLILDFIDQVIESGADAEEAARDFLNEYPEVRTLLIGAAIAVIVATIIEDVVTFGVGILNDPASIGVAVALIRVAQAGR
ncbi:MAG: DUF4157 domain-containing protein [Cyanobacteria bacterium P01_G01_bin.67]